MINASRAHSATVSPEAMTQPAKQRRLLRISFTPFKKPPARLKRLVRRHHAKLRKRRLKRAVLHVQVEANRFSMPPPRARWGAPRGSRLGDAPSKEQKSRITLHSGNRRSQPETVQSIIFSGVDGGFITRFGCGRLGDPDNCARWRLKCLFIIFAECELSHTSETVP